MSAFRGRAFTSLWFCLCVAATAGCGSDAGSGGSGGSAGGGGGGGDGSAPPTVTGGNYSVQYIAGTGIVEYRGTDVLVTLPVDGFVLGRVDALDNAKNYDPWPLVSSATPLNPPAGLHWLPATKAKEGESSANSFQLLLDHGEKQTSTLTVGVDADGSFKLSFVPDAGDTGIAYLQLKPLVDKSEAFYGLGEYYDDVNQRGKVRAMQLEIDNMIESGYNEAHVPIPLLIGTKGWGLFVANDYTAAFDVAAKAPDRVETTWGTGLASKDGLVFHLFGADKPIDITKHYYDLTGYPKLPARWALGPWVWRDENKDQAQVESDLDIMRDQDLPATGLWIDRPYATAVNTFDFNPAQFTDPQAMIDKMHALGFRTALWHTPYLDEKNSPDKDATKALRDIATAKGYYAPTSGFGGTNKWGRPIDLTNKDAYAWWQSLIKKYTDMGEEGFKMDYGEDVVAGLFGARNVWKFSDGSDERTMHERFQLFYHGVYADMLPKDGGFLLCRHSVVGDQKNGLVIWPGDLNAGWEHRGDVKPDGKHAVGGLPAAMMAGITLGPSGFPFYASDTGGYRDSPPNKELFTRWFEQTSTGSAMEIGTSSNDVAWEPTAANGFDAEMLGWYKRYTSLHLRLWPYEWTYAENIAKDGRPIQRAFGLVYPELGQHPWDEYLFGDDLLVAPVVEQGKTSRSVIFPPGDWVDWFDGSVHHAGTETVQAPLDKLPLYLRAGGIVPLLRPTIEAMAPTTDPTRVDSYATTPGVLYPRIVAGDKSTFTLFDGAEISQELAGSTLTLTSKDGSEFKYGVLFEVLATSKKPSSVSEGTEQASLAALEAATNGWFYDSANGGSLYVKVAAGAHTVTVST